MIVCFPALAGEHWAFGPVLQPAIPPAVCSALHPIDTFVQRKLAEHGLVPSPPADRRTLVRRVYFDLVGIPPTPEEASAFLSDPHPGAYERLIERLLASPRYGERWGRYWLDVARYSDTKGYVRLKDNPSYVGAWSYRDYVIRTLNQDKPYDRFVREQIAADRIPGVEAGDLAALGYLTLGQRFINSRPDIIDDRIDVVTRGMMGLTVACARCHDHKYDPVPTRDYYSLYGVFDNSIEPRIPPLAARDSEVPASYRDEFQSKLRKFNDYLAARQEQLRKGFLERAAEYFLAAQIEKIQPNFLPVMFLIDARKDLNPAMIHRLALFFAASRVQSIPVMDIWHALAAIPPNEFASRWRTELTQVTSREPALTAALQSALDRDPPSDLAGVAHVIARGLREADLRLSRSGEELARASGEWAVFLPLLRGKQAPFEVPHEDLEDYLYVDTTTQNEYHEQQRVIEDWISTRGIAPHAHPLEDAPVIREPRVFKRGNASDPGETVPRRFLSALSRGEPAAWVEGSGRLGLARAIADSNNPLTARVIVNRVWMHHFGAGLVRTPGDFGTRGDPPTHPELLDYLASRFMGEGWSLKSLHRSILLSGTYRQASTETKTGLEKDPQNKWLWRMNQRRLDWEAMRDAILAVSENLDSRMGGPSVPMTEAKSSTRRTVYGRIDRQNFPGVLRVFDVASPDACSAERHQTAGPPQALFLMNHPFVREQALRLSQRMLADAGASPALLRTVSQIYLRLFGRAPSNDELSWARAYLDVGAVGGARGKGAPDVGSNVAASSQSSADFGSGEWLSRWAEYVQALMLSNEFSFID